MITANQIAEYTRLCLELSDIVVHPPMEWTVDEVMREQELKKKILEMKKEMGLDKETK